MVCSACLLRAPPPRPSPPWLDASTVSLWRELRHYVVSEKWLLLCAAQQSLRTMRRLWNLLPWPCRRGQHLLMTRLPLLAMNLPEPQPWKWKLPLEASQSMCAESSYCVLLQARRRNLLNAVNDLTFRMQCSFNFRLVGVPAVSAIVLFSLLLAMFIESVLRQTAVLLTKQVGTSEKLIRLSTGEPIPTLPYAIRAREGVALWNEVAVSAVWLQDPTKTAEFAVSVLVSDVATPLCRMSALSLACRMLTLPTGWCFETLIDLTVTAWVAELCRVVVGRV